MEINQDTIRHLAELSNFALSDAEQENLTGDLQEIVKYISQLNAINTIDVEPTYQVFEMENAWREDKILPQDASPEELLTLAKETQNQQIKIPQVL